MLIRITNRCHMGCSHCMVDAGPEGEHMSIDTFRQVLEFCRTDIPILLISGGEPSEHPDILGLLRMAKRARYKTAFLTNGVFLRERPGLARRIKKFCSIGLQVTNDPRYYPQRLPSGTKCETLRTIAPFGRALKNGIPTTRMSPFCFNIRSATRYIGSYVGALQHLRWEMRMCSPSVNVDGTVVAGEAPSCCRLGTVWSSLDQITRSLINMQCNKCGLENNLEPKYREVIGL